MGAARKKVQRNQLITIRVTSGEASEFRRLAYIRHTTVAKLFREYVAGELAKYDEDLDERLHGRPPARPPARAKVVPMRRLGREVRRTGSR